MSEPLELSSLMSMLGREIQEIEYGEVRVVLKVHERRVVHCEIAHVRRWRTAEPQTDGQPRGP